MKTKNLPVRNSINSSPLRRAFFLTPLLLVCFAFAQEAQAVNPPPDGGYPGANTAEGTNALFSLTTGVWNTALGFQALNHNTTGWSNTATGFRALFSNTSFENTATGVNALYSNTFGIGNTANGVAALYDNTDGGGNAATGVQALYRNTTGGGNTASGARALFRNTTGNNNTANGLVALFNNVSGSNNAALGVAAGNNVTTANNVIAIGSNVSGENVSNTCYIGNIFGVTSAGGAAVYVNSLGKLGTVVSSRRFKKEIKPMDKASEAILALKPVTFHYKKDIEPQGVPQFGLVAEDVEKVNPDLVVRDGEGKVNTVRYEAVNAMLLNEFLKEHRKVQQQEATITELTSTVAQQRKDFEATTAQQQKEIQALTASVKEQAAQIQKVSAQLAAASPSGGGLEMSKSSPQVVLSNPVARANR
jgi:uncharacterized coiled-coil protein SlyX